MVEIPAWKSKLRASRQAALSSLTPEEEAERLQDDLDHRAGRAEKRAARSGQALFINQRAVIGDTPAEIAEKLGIGVPALRARARRWGHVLQQRAGYRRISAWIANRHIKALDALAAEQGVPREKALELLLSALLASGEARELLEALPESKPSAPAKRRPELTVGADTKLREAAPKARAPERIVEPV